MTAIDLYHNVDVAQSIVPGTYKTAQPGAAVDLKDYHSATVAIDVGVWTDGTHTFEVQESDAAGSGFGAVAAADLLGTEPVVDGAADDAQVYKIGYLGSKRYIKVVTTENGATGCAYGASVIRGTPRVAPVV
jgi:hypothetical protein